MDSNRIPTNQPGHQSSVGAGHRFGDIFLRAADASRPTERHHEQHQHQQHVNLAFDAPTCLDVLNGRGQGFQRHPGNVKYRRLVSLNKGLYAKCPAADKAKVSRGIVAAIREFGGRFLELDERSGTYSDIGDKKAWEKTSHALRDGQRKIRQKPHGGAPSDDFDMSLLASFAGRDRDGAIPEEAYFGYSVQALESLSERSNEGVPSWAPPGRRRSRGPSPAWETRTAPGGDAAEGASVDWPAARREGVGRRLEQGDATEDVAAYYFDPPAEPSAEARENEKRAGENLPHWRRHTTRCRTFHFNSRPLN